MRHYSQYGTVFLYEGHSTDGSAEMAESLGATIIPLDTDNQVRDDIFVDMKNNCWKESKADWVIVCDMDEFVYHPDLKNYLKTIEHTIIAPRTYEMISDFFPTTGGQIYEEVKFGFEIKPKFFLFKPTELLEMTYGAGCHDAQPEGNVYIYRNSEIKCMHFRHLSIDHVVQRNAYLYSRLSDENKRMGWGWHIGLPRERVEAYFNENREKLIKVI
jgi:hypothetical protein